ncbi:DinB family protein [Ohtaekwangia sp.]|uniref:DinB family protein n=1 Tax=Ohtaekwangia sp. TaxID=2066019 RepID=UPI002F9395AF
MKTVALELQQIVITFTEKIEQIQDHDFSAKPLPHKWSKKEILGHLADSAQNNLRRFICGQYESAPPRITYDQNAWVSLNQYQAAKKEDVITLWKLLNERISAVLLSMPQENYGRTCVNDSAEYFTLEWLAIDYVKHLKHHLNQIIPGSFDVV